MKIEIKKEDSANGYVFYYYENDFPLMSFHGEYAEINAIDYFDLMTERKLAGIARTEIIRSIEIPGI